MEWVFSFLEYHNINKMHEVPQAGSHRYRVTVRTWTLQLDLFLIELLSNLRLHTEIKSLTAAVLYVSSTLITETTFEGGVSWPGLEHTMFDLGF